MEVKNVRRIIRLKALIMPGTMSEVRLSSMPSCFTSRYSGIIPPLKNMVKIISIEKKDLPFRCSLVSG
ncbi:hypothetical protein D3C80_2058110 [compost metagenome]